MRHVFGGEGGDGGVCLCCLQSSVACCIALELGFEFVIAATAPAFAVEEDADNKGYSACMGQRMRACWLGDWDLPMMLRVIAAASAPLLMMVG